MKEKLTVIKVELDKLPYSQDSILDMLNLLKRAIELAKEENPDRRSNNCLNNFLQTEEKEVNELLEIGISEEEKKRRFDTAKSHFRADLSECLFF